jgi:rubrerythrin
MAEYIDKDRLILCMNDWMLQNAPVKAGDDTTRADTILDAIKMVEDSPAADVRENVRARWIDMGDHLLCSGCGATHYGADKNFCPNCGAKMGGAEDG